MTGKILFLTTLCLSAMSVKASDVTTTSDSIVIDSAPQKYLYSYSNFGSFWNLRDSSDFSSLTYFSLMDSKKSRIS